MDFTNPTSAIDPLVCAPSAAPVTITNKQFMQTVFGKQPGSTWVAGFKGSPQTKEARWGGEPYILGSALNLPGDGNTYFCVAELKFGAGRKKASFERMAVLVADDADPANLKAQPSYIIETSPGRVQIGYILQDTAESRDPEQCDRVLKAMADVGLVNADTSGNNRVRYVRLPVGSNTKYDGAPRHRLTVWRPDLTYTLTAAAAAVGVDVRAQPAPAVTNAVTSAVRDSAIDGTDAEVEWVDDGPGRLDVGWAESQIVSGESLHDPLIRLAAHYAQAGLAAEEIFRILAELMNRSAAKEADSDRWSARMAKLKHDTIASALRKYGNSYGAKVDQTDLGNVNLLASLTAGDLRYVVDDEVWLRWTAGRWEVDNTKQHSFAATVLVAEDYAKEAARLEAQLTGMDRATAKQHQKRVDAVRAWEKACRNRRGIDNMLALAQKHPAFVISASALNTDPHLLGAQNGVVDLRTGDLRPDARDDFVTRRSAYAYRPGAAAPRWGRFMAEVTGYPIAAERDCDAAVIASTVGRFRARPEYADYLQRALGYSATGLTVEHKMFCVFGEHGSNGKNVAFDAVKAVLGGYAATVSNMLLLAGKRGRDANDATPALMPLKGARLALCSEPPAGATFDNAVVKALVGEAKISGRENYGRVGEIAVAFHLWMLCNEKPRVEHLEGAMASRILMLPFDREWNRAGSAEHDPALPDADKGLATELQAEGEGILAWLVQGAMRYFTVGLLPCAEVAAATKSYFAAQRVDPIGMWLAGISLCAPAAGETATNLFNDFSAWRVARESAGSLRGGESPLTLTAFGLALRKRGIESAKHGLIRYGIRLAHDFEAPPDQAAKDEYRRLMAEFGDLA